VADCPKPLAGLRLVRIDPGEAASMPASPCHLAEGLPELQHWMLDLRLATADDYPWPLRIDWPLVLFPRWTRLERWWQDVREIAWMRWDRWRR
jgi:hypothetical protein